MVPVRAEDVQFMARDTDKLNDERDRTINEIILQTFFKNMKQGGTWGENMGMEGGENMRKKGVWLEGGRGHRGIREYLRGMCNRWRGKSRLCREPT